MTRRKSLQTIHEPFGDAFYYGPERMGSRFEDDEKARAESGFADSTFKTILDRIENEADEVCHLPCSPRVIDRHLSRTAFFILPHLLSIHRNLQKIRFVTKSLPTTPLWSTRPIMAIRSTTSFLPEPSFTP